MGELFGFLVPGVVEADGAGEGFDRIRGAGEEVPAFLVPRTALTLHVHSILAAGEIRPFGGIKAYGDHVEFLADIEL
jgi:hypothetical protein